jgi:hypothetical protein
LELPAVTVSGLSGEEGDADQHHAESERLHGETNGRIAPPFERRWGSLTTLPVHPTFLIEDLDQDV